MLVLHFMVILATFTYFGPHGSHYFNDYRKTKLHSMIEQTVLASLDCREKVYLINRFVGYAT